MSVPQSTYPITGILPPPGSNPPLRQEIDTWYQDPENLHVVNLFILALAKFQSLSVLEKLSYYQVAGIHGLPHVPWDEDPKTHPSRGDYCTHNSILFPAWHRPYILLFEQRLFEIMRDDIIPSFPESRRPELLAAAQKFRFPYWDWAEKKPSGISFLPHYNVPRIVRDKDITVDNGTQVLSIPNPLYAFRTEKPMGDNGEYSLPDVNGAPYSKCRATSRCPPVLGGEGAIEAWTSDSGVQNHDQVVRNLRKHSWYQSGPDKIYTDTLGEAVYRLFSKDYFSKYAAFASTIYTSGGSPPDYLSCEGIHNNVHNWIGETGAGPGHMCEIAVAAFDPIFWLHHCNIDRQFAIWQTLNPTSWFSDSPTPTPDTPLAPFHTDATGVYYTSNIARDWTKFHYSYPELQPWLPKYIINGKFSEAAYLLDVRLQVNKLYGTTRNKIFKVERSFSSLFKVHEGVSVEHSDYIVNVLYDKFALGGLSFTIHVFIGEHAKVGSVYNFSSPLESPDGGCENCRTQQASSVLSTGQLHITSQLLDDVEAEAVPLKSFSQTDVEEYLTKNLHWSVTKARGENVPLDQIPSLKVSVAVGKGIHYRDDIKLSHYSQYAVLSSITTGHPGGL